MSQKTRVVILDDHQSIIDGYLYRLSHFPQIEVVATINYGEELETTLKKSATDVLLLDVNVPTNGENSNPYPILYTIPKLLQVYPELNILVISMYAEKGLIRAVMEAGASGYILKEDQATIRELGNVVVSVASGGIHFSQKAHRLFLTNQQADGDNLLTGRQLEALSLCSSYPNSTTSELAQKMMVSNSTVRNLLSGAYIRLGVHTRAAAIAKAREMGIITPYSPAFTA
jgi:DNA-binding NarL/FixJ family response regulator